VVHLRGKPRLIVSESELEAVVERLTHVYESHMPSPWKPNLSSDWRSKLLDAIVGLEIEVTDIQAKFKLSQNRPPEDQQCVAERLSQSGNQTQVAVAALMAGVHHAGF
jgi:transcriptional regulator